MGLVRPKADGKGTLTAETRRQVRDIAGHCAGLESLGSRGLSPTTWCRCFRAWVVTPGTCHGSAQGKNGFKLSLRGYDPLFDVRSLTDDLAARHINLASPDDSMMLSKPAGIGAARGGALDPAR